MLKDVYYKLREAYGIDFYKLIWPQVRDIVAKSLMAADSSVGHNPNCFELFGYDIMIDTNYECKLIEINSSPSLAKEILIDELVKQKMIDEIIDLVDATPIN
mmetsp:Transcript_48726/g.106137  ORF Transcript_48726/g.106137 Transcript_48726/m.106137 type:complete len:102 (+) Transcript_48726:995-1300(+)